jgi:prepilin-type processing-associated H-X9-DG protein
LKQIGLAMHNYESVAGAFPITGVVDTRPSAFAHWVGWSGHARILPLMEQGPMFNSCNFTLPYSTADNYTVASTAVSSFICPSELDPSPTPASSFFNTPKGITNYGLNMGDWFVFSATGPVTRGVFTPNISRKFSNFTDGTSNTVMASEVKVRNPEYNCIPGLSLITDPANVPPPTADPFTVAPEYGGTCGAVGQGHTAWVDGNAQETGMTTAWPPNKKILGKMGEGDLDLQGSPLFLGGSIGPTFAAITSRSYHPGGVNALLTDGSVRFIKDSVAGAVWRSLGTISGGEVVSADAY